MRPLICQRMLESRFFFVVLDVVKNIRREAYVAYSTNFKVLRETDSLSSIF